MKRILSVVMLLLIPSVALAGLPSYWSWNSVGGDWSCVSRTGGGLFPPPPEHYDIYTDATSPDPPSVLRITYPAGWPTAKEPAHCSNSFSKVEELYVQYRFKYSSGYQFHGTDNKQLYFQLGVSAGVKVSDWYLTVNGSRKVNVVTQTYATDRHTSNTGYDPTIQTNTWYTMTARFKMNTPGTANGILQVWLDGNLVIDKNTVGYRSSSQSGYGVVGGTITPVFGGTGGAVKAATDYQYYDLTQFQTQAFGEEATDTTPPYVSSRTPASNATGVPVTSRTVSRTVADSGDGLASAYPTMTVDGVAVSCSAGATCSGTAASRTITYTKGSDWDYGDTIPVVVTACDAAGNCSTDSSTFTTAYAPSPGTGTKTKAQVLAYLAGLKNLSSKKLMSGQRLSTLNTWVASDNTEWNEISALTGGTVPAIAGFDFSCGSTFSECDYTAGIARVVAHWNAGGIPYFTHHSANPTTNEWSWPIGTPSFTFSKIYTPGYTEYDNYRLQLEKIGDAIQLLEDNNVVILFAPFHESNMSSDVFWWSGKSTSQLKLAWEYVRGYLEGTRGLSNILWVYAGYPWESDVTTYYTALGDNNVDIIGFDYYSSNSRFNDSSIISRWNTLASYGKPMAITELGMCSSTTHNDTTCSNGDARVIVNDLSNNFPAAVWWMNWDEEDLDFGLNSMQYVPQALADSRVVVLADNPSGALGADTVAIQTTSLTTMRVGTAYSFSLTSVLGSTPYSYAVTAGTIPAGLVLSSSGAITGTPTTEGAYDFTVTVTDANTDTDDQQFTGTVLPKLPGGQVTTTSFTLADTYVNSGAATTNYSDNAANRLYQWPIGTVANRTLVQVASLGLPDNISVTSATLYMYLSTWDGSGGTTPMNAYVYPVTGQSWTIGNVTWNTLDNAAVGAYESVTAVPLTAGWYSWTVTEAVQAAYAGASALTLLIDGGQDGAADTNRYFVSMDGAEAQRPYLSVTYTLLTPEGIPVSAPGRFRVVNFKGSIR